MNHGCSAHSPNEFPKSRLVTECLSHLYRPSRDSLHTGTVVWCTFEHPEVPGEAEQPESRPKELH